MDIFNTSDLMKGSAMDFEEKPKIRMSLDGSCGRSFEGI
jgi:hypothetical protein